MILCQLEVDTLREKTKRSDCKKLTIISTIFQKMMFRQLTRITSRKNKYIRLFASSGGETMETAAHEVVKWQKYTAGLIPSVFDPDSFKNQLYCRDAQSVCIGVLVQLSGRNLHSPSSSDANRHGLSAHSQQAFSLARVSRLRPLRHGLLEEMQRRK